jgi:effector-binding domain-containing protein
MNAEPSGNDVEFRQLEPRPVLYIRATAQIEQLGEAMGDRIQALSSYIRERGAQPAGPPFVRYHTFGETETDFEFGVPVVKPVAGEGRIATGELPGGPAVSTWHFGPDDKLGEAYARIETWLKQHDRERDGAAWEAYYWLDLAQPDASNLPDPSTWRTQLVQPVK